MTNFQLSFSVLVITLIFLTSESSAFTDTFRPISLQNPSRNGRTQSAAASLQPKVGTSLNANGNGNNERNGSKTFVLKKGSNEIKEVMGSRKKGKANNPFRLGSFFRLNAVEGSGDESLGSSQLKKSTTGSGPSPSSKPTPLKLVDESDAVEATKTGAGAGAGGFKLDFLNDLFGKGSGSEKNGSGNEAEQSVSTTAPPVAVSAPAVTKAPESVSSSPIGDFFDSIKTKINPSADKGGDQTPPIASVTPISTSTEVITSSPIGKETSSPAPPDATDKFTFAQRIESTKTGIVGLLAGGLAITPFTALHDIAFPGDTIENGLAQWEFDTDTGSIAAALFAIVYRYCVREGEEKNEMLPMGVVGAFVVVRTLGRIRVSRYCDFAPLDCGEPLGYFDWEMLQQAAFSGLESAALFGFTAVAMEYCYKKGYISRFQ